MPYPQIPPSSPKRKLDKDINLELLHLFRKCHTKYQKDWVYQSQVLSISVLITYSNDINIYTISSCTNSGLSSLNLPSSPPPPTYCYMQDSHHCDPQHATALLPELYPPTSQPPPERDYSPVQYVKSTKSSCLHDTTADINIFDIFRAYMHDVSSNYA